MRGVQSRRVRTRSITLRRYSTNQGLGSLLEHSLKLTLILSFAVAIAAISGGCTTSSKEAGQVQELEPGTYSVGLSRTATSGILSSTTAKTEIDAATARAGEFCHAKGQKYVHKAVVGNRIVFKCVSGDPKPQ